MQSEKGSSSCRGRAGLEMDKVVTVAFFLYVRSVSFLIKYFCYFLCAGLLGSGEQRGARTLHSGASLCFVGCEEKSKEATS